MWIKYFPRKGVFSPAALAAVSRYPGVAVRGTIINAPDNAAWLVEQELSVLGEDFDNSVSTPDLPSIASVDELVGKGLREWVPGFMTPYQKEGVVAMSGRSGMFFWAPGCLSGATEIVVNRGGCARRMLLRDLVAKFNGGETRNLLNGRISQWDLSIPTYTQSVDESTGFIVKNRILAAVYSGVKATFVVTTENGNRIQATADHLFWTPSGWKKLSELKIGDEVMVESWPKKTTKRTKKYYDEVDHMWNHPNAVRRQVKRSDRPGIRKTARVPTHRLVVEADMNRCTLPEFVGRIVLGDLDGLEFLGKDTHVHHVDGDSKNNELTNLTVLSATDHLRHHGKDSSWKHVSARSGASKIIDIFNYGEEETFDLSMEDPHNNFVANGIVVHNSGKTLGAIAWSLCIEGKTVVTTRAPVRRNFAREIERFTTHRAYVVEGTKPIDFTALSDDYRYLVFGHEILPDHVENILKWQPSSFVLDESQRIKSSKRFRATPNEDGTLSFDRLENIAVAAYRISRGTRRRLLLTGSPIKDRVRDLWAQLDLAQPEAWGPFYRAGKPSFTARYCSARPGMYGGIDTTGASNLDELWDRVSLAINQVAYSTTHRDLPPKRRIATFIPPHEQDTTRGFEKIFEAADKKGKTNAVEARLMEAAARKRSYLMGLLEEAVENKQKVVVFTGRREDCDRLIREATKKFGKVADVIGAHGGHPSAYRDELQQKYMSSKAPIILIGTGDAWGEGVNLHDSDLFIISMLPYTPGQIIQWEGRVSRQGQKRPVMIQYLIAEGTVDEHVASLLTDKLPAVETVARDESITGLSDSLLGFDNEEALLDSILGKIGDVVVTEDDD